LTPLRDSALSAALKHDSLVVIVALLAVTALAWGYIIPLGLDMAAMGAMSMPLVPWTVGHLWFMFFMWTVMMVGMMTPSVAPMILIYTQVARHSASRGEFFASAGWFAGGYLTAWTLFAAVATLAQWGLEALALITPMMVSANRVFGGLMLIAAGIYQWLPIKQACLAQCRSPLSFVQSHGGFQPSVRGSLRLGVLHGLYCIGCCWALMALLFVGGVMNLLWIAALMIFVLAEKLLRGGSYLPRIAGLVAMGAGGWMIVR
jgi:predicted metal-binding membrane protein